MHGIMHDVNHHEKLAAEFPGKAAELPGKKAELPGHRIFPYQICCVFA